MKNEVTVKVGCGGLCVCGANPYEPLWWGGRGDDREGPEGLSCPSVHGAALKEGTRCWSPGRGMERSMAYVSAPTTVVGCAPWGLLCSGVGKGGD